MGPEIFIAVWVYCAVVGLNAPLSTECEFVWDETSFSTRKECIKSLTKTLIMPDYKVNAVGKCIRVNVRVGQPV